MSGLVRQRHVLHDVFTLLTSTVASQGLLLAVLPALTRAYSVEQFGFYGGYTAAVGILGIVINLRMDLSVVTADSHDRAAQLLRVSVGLACGMTAVALLLAGVCGGLYAWWAGKALPIWVWAAPLAAGASAIFNTLCSWHNRHSRFRTMASFRFLQTAMLVSLQFAFIWWLPVHDGLIWAAVLAYVTTAMWWLWRTYRQDHAQLKKPDPELGWRATLTGVRQFSVQAMGVDALSQVLYQLPLAFLGYLFSPVAMGYYTLTQRALAVPANLVGSSVAEVFRQRATAAFNQRGECQAEFTKAGAALGLLSLAGSIPLFWLLPDLFALVFGEKWRAAAEFARILLPVYVAKFVSHPLAYVILLTGKLKFELWLHVIMLAVLSAGMAMAGAMHASATTTLAFYACAYVTCYLAYLTYSYQLSRGRIVRTP